METNDLLKFDLKELSADETLMTDGGESLWYWIAYGIGSIGRSYTNAMEAYGNAQLASANMN